jgi:hypothetical protein
MATIKGTVNGGTCISKSPAGYGTREVWLLSLAFAAYTGSTDDAQIDAVAAEINAIARDGKTRTLRWAAPANAGYDTNAQAVYVGGGSVQAMTISTNDLTGNLTVAAGTEITTSTAASGVGLFVAVDVS